MKRRKLAVASMIWALVAITQAAFGSLSGALDTTLTFTTGGSTEWFSQSIIYYHDGDAAQSGDINDCQNSWIRTTVNGPGTIRFYWKVSSEESWDFLLFCIDDSVVGWISGEVDWCQEEFTITTAGPHSVKWHYVKDMCISDGNDSGWVDKVEWESGSAPPPPPPPPPLNPLSEALDTALIFTTGGDANWFSQNTTYYYCHDAAQSGDINDCQDSWMQTTVDGPGTIKFFWKISSEESWDFLLFYIDGSVVGWTSGEVDWCQQEFAITTSGLHSLKWRYVKDQCVDSGSDCGWVDKVEWESGSAPPPPPLNPLSEALDTALIFTTGGDANWFSQNTTYYYCNDAAQSGDINDCQDSWMQTTVDGPGTIKFFWKVSSEESWDFLLFYIDGSVVGWTSGEVDWCQQEFAITTAGTHILRWRYIKDMCISDGNDSGWVDKVEWESGSPPPPPPPPPPPTCPFSAALDTTLCFVTGGDANWFCQNTIYHYDCDAAQSGDINDCQNSWMQTTVDGPGTIKFFWKVSSEKSWDFLLFCIDGSVVSWISGEVDWCQQEFAITTAGTHTLRWRYIKDRCVDSGSDCGWVDKVEWESGSPPPPPPPPPLNPLSEALDTALIFTTGGDANWFSQNTIYHYDCDAAQSGDINDCQDSWMQTTVDGPGTIKFYWKVSSEESWDFLLFCIDGSVVGWTSGEVDWCQEEFAITTAGTHTLRWRYIKDICVDSGSDCGWVDKVEWEPAP